MKSNIPDHEGLSLIKVNYILCTFLVWQTWWKTRTMKKTRRQRRSMFVGLPEPRLWGFARGLTRSAKSICSKRIDFQPFVVSSKYQWFKEFMFCVHCTLNAFLACFTLPAQFFARCQLSGRPATHPYWLMHIWSNCSDTNTGLLSCLSPLSQVK